MKNPREDCATEATFACTYEPCGIFREKNNFLNQIFKNSEQSQQSLGFPLVTSSFIYFWCICYFFRNNRLESFSPSLKKSILGSQGYKIKWKTNSFIIWHKLILIFWALSLLFSFFHHTLLQCDLCNTL